MKNIIENEFPSYAIVNGIFHFENQPTFLVSGDYPYYRDNPENWQDIEKK